MRRLRSGPIIVVLVLTLFISNTITTVDAGPLNSFFVSPIPFWDDDSLDTATTWDSTEQSITVAYSDLNETGWYEDFSDVSDWSALYGGPGITTDGSYGKMELPNDNDYDYVCNNDISGDYDTYTVEFQTKFNSTTGVTAFVIFKSADDYGGSTVLMCAIGVRTYWYYQSYTFSSSTTVESVAVVAKSSGSDTELLIDYIKVSNGIGSLDLGVPIHRQNHQEIELYMNTTSLDSEVRLELYNNVTASGTYITVNSSYINLIDESFLGHTYVSTSGLSRIIFSVDNERKSASIAISDQDNFILDYWFDSYILSGNNFLRLTDSSFNGSFILYYINGDTNYEYYLNPPEWEESGSPNATVYQHLYGLDTFSSDSFTSHSVNYTAEFPYLSYVRSEWSYLTNDIPILEAPDFKQGMRIQFDYDNDTPQFDIYWELSTFCNSTGWYETSYWYFNEYINGVATTLVEAEPSYESLTLSSEYYVEAKNMFWRTQEDHIGIMVWDSEESWSLWGNNETIHVSENVGENFDANITLVYEITDSVVYSWSKCDFIQFEYEYYIDSGLAQPHFSSTYHDRSGSHDRSKPRPYGGISIDDWISASPEKDPLEIAVNVTVGWDPLGDFMGFWSNVFNNAFAIVGVAIADVANTISSGFISGILGVVNLLAGMFEAILNAIAPGVGTAIVGSISGLIGIAASIINLIVLFFSWMAGFVTIIAQVITWIQTYLFTESVAQIILLTLGALPLLSFSGMNILDRGTGIEGAVNWFSLYLSVAMGIVGLVWRLISGILDLISGFVPMT